MPEALADSLAALQTDYVDLYLVHWPCSLDPAAGGKAAYSDWDFVDTWREVQKLLDTGKVRNIGVSNFGIKNMEKLLSAETTKVRLPHQGPSVREPRLTNVQHRSSPPSTRSSCTLATPPPS